MATATFKTKSALLAAFSALFVDNQTGDVTPDLALDEFLDLIKSTMGGYFHLGSNSPSTPMTPSLTTSYAAITNFPVSLGSDVTVSASAGTVTIPSGGDGDWELCFSTSILPTSSVVALDAGIFKGAAVDPIVYGTGPGQTQAGSLQLWNVPVVGGRIVTLAAGDVLSFKAKASGATATNCWIDVWGKRVG